MSTTSVSDESKDASTSLESIDIKSIYGKNIVCLEQMRCASGKKEKGKHTELENFVLRWVAPELSFTEPMAHLASLDA